jgi:hypothetical protein
MKHELPHAANRFGLENVECDDKSLRAYVDGKLAMLVEINGAGQVVDRSEEFGLSHKFCKSPIPKESRLYKQVGGKLVKDEKHDDRAKSRAEFCDSSGVVLSCEKLAEAGFKFDDKQVCLEKPSKKE